jgi:septum formation protein
VTAATTESTAPRLILASTSPHRRKLLARLGLPFDVVRPRVDESARPGEPPGELAARLASLKSASTHIPDAIVIGSDQVAALDGRVLRKPGTTDRAVEQLMLCQGRVVEFHTAVTLVYRRSGARLSETDLTRVHFRKLEQSAIERYVAAEQPLDCAGGFKAEGLGIALFESIESNDPTGLIGLPLIWLSGALRSLGLDPLTVQPP